MRSISLDNPVYLFILIPLLLFIIIPYAISIRRDNRSKSVVTSLVLHILIAVMVAFGLAGTVLTTIMTKTEVIIVADVSYSGNRNFDKIDEYINTIVENSPARSEFSIVCFGKDAVTLTKMGDDIVSVKNAEVDDSATDITSAIKYASELFSDGVIKRMVLISDGKQTDTEGMGGFISAVEGLTAQDIYIDAMYLDNNISVNSPEVQINGVEYTKSTYLNHESSVSVLLQSNINTEAIASIYKKNESGEYSKIDYVELELNEGFNVVNFDLDTSADGIYEYKVDVFSKDDYSSYNNEYMLAQSVSGKRKVLLLTEKEDDIVTAKQLYGDLAEIDTYFVTEKMEVLLGLDMLKTPEARKENNIYLLSPHTKDKLPVTIEAMCAYDEILISNADVRNIENFTAFVDVVDKAVSDFGKSLVTMGDNKIQNKSDDILKALEDMLPVKYGNYDQDAKFLAIILDTSRSMENANHYTMAKTAAKQLVSLLAPTDYVAVIGFNGDVEVEVMPTLAKDKEAIMAKIDSLDVKQGTRLDAGLKRSFDLLKDYESLENKQVMLISDGMSYTLDDDSPVSTAQQMYEEGIIVSSINLATVESKLTMERIAIAGGGSFYFAEDSEDIGELILQEVANEITETVVERPTDVIIKRKSDSSISGIAEFPQINGYIFGKAKSSATTVIAAKHIKTSATGVAKEVEVPLYTYWKYGEGKVASLMTDMTGDWMAGWIDSGVKSTFFRNTLDANTPEEKIDHPYTMNVSYDGKYTNIEIVPAVLNTSAKVNVEITFPESGKIINKDLIFDSQKYFYSFETSELGKYDILVTYSYENGEDTVIYPSNTFFNLAYSPEYDSFNVFDSSALHGAIRQRGQISENGEIKIENDEKTLDTYEVDFTMPFLIGAAVLYIVDVIIRKLKWSDITSLFKKKSKKA